MVKHFKVSAELGLPAHVFLLERDSAAFRSLVATVGQLHQVAAPANLLLVPAVHISLRQATHAGARSGES